MKLRLLLLAATALFSSMPAQARPVSVVLYPAGALVTEEETIRPEGGNIVLRLPAGADEGSLEFSLAKGTAEGWTAEMRKGELPSGVDGLRRELNALDDEAALLRARRENLTYERQFQSLRKSPVSDEAGRETQEKNLAARLEEIAVKDASLAASLRDLAARRKSLEQRLEELGGRNDGMIECTLHTSGTGTEPVPVRWSYYLNDAGWQPRYLVRAEQDEGKVVIAMEAVLRQGSGADWNDVAVTLSSTEDFRSVTPPPLPEWIMGGENVRAAKSMNLMAARAAAGNDEAMPAGASVLSHASGLRWNLGRVNVPAGARAARPVDSHEFEASFFRLVRPTEDGRAWITAVLDEESLPLLPAGQAAFMVDGTENARGVLRTTPGDRRLSFGVDQLVTVKKHELPADNTEAPAGGKVEVRHWRADIFNGHDKPVEVRAEAAAPILRNARMSAKAKSRPAADFNEELSLYEWRLEIPARKTSSITHEVTVITPADASAVSK